MAVSVVGFDVGSLSCYVSVARQGGIETVANEYSDRCTPTCVSFGEKSRCAGASAKQQMVSNVKNTVYGFTQFLGKQFNDPKVQKLIPHYPYKIVELDKNRIGIQVQYLNETTVLTPEQITAFQLTKLKEVAESNLHAKVTDCVINVPTHYTDAERRSMLDAAQIAGLNCTRLLNDLTASGITYGIYNQELPEPDQKAKYMALVDMGYSNLQVAIIALNRGKMRVVATSCDGELGGVNFDTVIYREMCAIFAEKYKINVETSPKARCRLYQECEKLKKLMSANSTDLPLNIECFMEDKDVTARMNRATFETLAGDLLKRAEVVLTNVLIQASMKPEEIDTVEIVGGSTRIPCIKEMIQRIFGKEPRTSMNLDEAVARGCALQSAIFSPAFRVRDFSITDACPYSISLHYEEPTGLESTEVFPQWHQFPFSRQLTFYRKEPFIIEAKYTNPDNVPNAIKVIGSFKIQNVVPTPTGEAAKIKVKLRVNNHGIFTISQAQLVEKVEKEVEPEPATKSPAKDSPKKPAATENDNAPPPETPNVNGTDAPTEEKMETSPEDAAKGAENEAGTPPTDGQKKTKIVSRFVDLPVQAVLMQYTKAKLDEFAEFENKMIMQDKMEKDRSLAKNSLEEYVYEMRERLYGAYDSFVTEAELASFQTALTSTEDWLYAEGEDLQKQAYVDRLVELKTTGDRFVSRAKEAEDRPVAVEEFGRLCVGIQKALDSYHAGDEQYNHWTIAEVEKLVKCLEEKQKWFNHEMTLQNAKKLNEDPVLTAIRIRLQKQSLEAVSGPILNKKKPAPPAQPPKDNQNNVNAGDQSAAPNGTAESPKASTDTPAADNASEASKKEDMDID